LAHAFEHQLLQDVPGALRPPAISSENRFACPTTRLVERLSRSLGLHHGGVHAHSAPSRQPVGLSQLHEPLVNLLTFVAFTRHRSRSQEDGIASQLNLFDF
jgi:hypothetical protein